MPNIPPYGAFGRVDAGGGAPTAVIDAVATQIGETAPRNVLEIWVADAAGAKKLVWTRTPDGPTSASIAYVAATPAANGLVRVTITPLADLKSDSYQIKRPDGSVAGTTSQSATTFDDVAPLPLSGTYTVTALLAGLTDATPVATNSLNLSTAPGALTLSQLTGPTRIHLVWSAPSWGKPHQYQIYKNGSFYTTVSGDVTSYDDTGVIYGATTSYTVYPVLSGVRGANGSTNSTAVAQDPPTSVSLINNAADSLQLSWAAPATGAHHYDVEKYDTTVGVWVAYTSLTGLAASWSTVNPGYGRVRAVSSTGVVSGWVQAGPVTPKPPPPSIIVYVNCAGGACGGGYNDFSNELGVDATYSGVQPSFCAQYYWSAFPQYGWQDATDPSPCQLGDNITGGRFWFVPRLQLNPTYGRVNRVRNGVASDWTQVGPV